jgi:hypothetical protein
MIKDFEHSILHKVEEEFFNLSPTTLPLSYPVQEGKGQSISSFPKHLLQNVISGIFPIVDWRWHISCVH